MARRRRPQRREVLPDYKFKSILVTRFINCMMECGKKRIAEDIFYTAIDLAGERSQQDGLGMFKKAIDNIKPQLEVKSRRIGGANYQVPIEVAPERRSSLAIRWLIKYSRERSEKNMAEKLANEIVQASKGEGAAVRKRVDTHKMAEANKAFAHFRW